MLEAGPHYEIKTEAEEPPPSIIATHVAQPSLEVSFTLDRGIIPKLVSVLDNDAATLKSKLHAATLLQHLCKGGRPGRGMSADDVRDAIYQAGGLGSLCRGLHGFQLAVKVTSEEQLVCCACAAALTAVAEGEDPFLLATIAIEDGIAPLAAMLVAPSAKMQTHAASVLAYLALHPELCGVIAGHEAINPLRDLVSLGTAETRGQAARALMNLTFENTANQHALLDGGGVDPLVGLLISSESRDAQRYAGRTLVHLARCNAAAAGFVRSRLLRSLLPPYALEFRVHQTVQRRRMRPWQSLSVLATLCSISAEPARLCLERELTPVDDIDDEDDQEGVNQMAGAQVPPSLALRASHRGSYRRSGYSTNRSSRSTNRGGYSTNRGGYSTNRSQVSTFRASARDLPVFRGRQGE